MPEDKKIKGNNSFNINLKTGKQRRKLIVSSALSFFIILTGVLIAFNFTLADALNSYNKSFGDSLTAPEWNNLDDDFLNTFDNDTINGALTIYRSTGDNAELKLDSGASSHWGLYQDRTTKDLRFWNNDVLIGSGNLLTLTNEGNVGIGTTGPTNPLTISAPTGDAFSNIPLLFIRNTTLSNTLVTSMVGLAKTSSDMSDGFGSRLLFALQDSAFGGSSNVVAGVGAVRSGADNSGALVFQTYNAGSVGEAMRIDNLGYVGIGTNNPGALLHVTGNIKVSDSAGEYMAPVFETDVVSKKYVDENFAPIAGGGYWQVGGNTLTAKNYIGSTSNHDIGFKTNDTERMTILAGGNVGIGTSSPSKILHLVTPSISNAMIFESTAEATWLRFILTNSVQNWHFGFNGNSSDFIFRDATNSQYPFTIESGTLSDTLYLSSEGKVGIGTTSPTSTLHVVGGGYFSDPVTVGSPVNDGHAVTKNYLESYVGGEVGSAFSGSGTANYVTKFTDTYGLGNSIIYDNGTNVGIGTSGPISKLHINGGIGSLATGLTFGDGDTGIYENSDDTLYISNAGSNIWIINNSILGGGNGRGAISASYPSLTTPGLLPRGNKSDLGIGGTNDSELTLITGGQTRLYVDSIGRIGIGTITPRAKLDIYGSNNFVYVDEMVPVNDHHLVAKKYVDETFAPLVGPGAALTGSGTTNYVPLWTGAGELGNSSIYESSGNVAIGTTSASYKLQVSTDAGFASNNTVIDDTGNITTKSLMDKDNVLYKLDPSATGDSLSVAGNLIGGGYIRMSGAGNNYVMGNMGIGTDSPNANLDIVRSTSGKIMDMKGSNLDIWWRIGHVGDTYGYYWQYDGTGAGNENTLRLLSENAADTDFDIFKFYQTTGGMEVYGGYSSSGIDIRQNGDLYSSGKIGIGTAAPAKELHVVGSMVLNDGLNNVLIGTSVGNGITTGYSNTAVGKEAFVANSSGFYNVAFGERALYSNTTDVQNTAIGAYALSNTIERFNTGVGFAVLNANTTGQNNTAIGRQAGRYITDGVTGNTTGNYNVFIGGETKANADGETNQIVIGYNATGNGSNSVTIGNNSVTKTILKGVVTVGTPIEDYHATTKAYVDSTVSSGVNAGIDGTINYLSKFNTANSVADSQVYDNGTNVGIGTNSPLTKLHIKGSQVGLRIDGSTSSTGGAYFYGLSGGSNIPTDLWSGTNAQFNGSTWNRDDVLRPAWTFGMASGSNDYFRLRHVSAGANPISWTTIMQVDSSNNIAFNTNDLYISSSNSRIGIGTTLPSATLDIITSNSYAILAGNQKIGNVATPTEDTDVVIKSYVDNNFAPITGGVGSAFVQGGNSFTGVATLGTNDNYNLDLKTNNEKRLTILNTGKIGIGTTNPTNILHLSTAGTNINP
ncbi:MAG: hypothetical protein K9M44_04305, partial [Candidatus Pacebacteria bacterium]|nr:hypothetical protein [Candidatus Paceibacterota bacterium]